LNGLSDDGGRDEFDESASNRRRNSTTSACKFSITTVWPVICVWSPSITTA
jgi:hypothetical protein